MKIFIFAVKGITLHISTLYHTELLIQIHIFILNVKHFLMAQNSPMEQGNQQLVSNFGLEKFPNFIGKSVSLQTSGITSS